MPSANAVTAMANLTHKNHLHKQSLQNVQYADVVGSLQIFLSNFDTSGISDPDVYNAADGIQTFVNDAASANPSADTVARVNEIAQLWNDNLASLTWVFSAPYSGPAIETSRRAVSSRYKMDAAGDWGAASAVAVGVVTVTVAIIFGAPIMAALATAGTAMLITTVVVSAVCNMGNCASNGFVSAVANGSKMGLGATAGAKVTGYLAQRAAATYGNTALVAVKTVAPALSRSVSALSAGASILGGIIGGARYLFGSWDDGSTDARHQYESQTVDEFGNRIITIFVSHGHWTYSDWTPLPDATPAGPTSQ